MSNVTLSDYFCGDEEIRFSHFRIPRQLITHSSFKPLSADAKLLYGMLMDVTEKEADIYQQILKHTIPQFQEIGVNLFIWDGVAWYDDPRNMTAHTIIAIPAVWLPFEEQGQSVAGWLPDAVNGHLKDYGLDLVNKQY